MAAPRWDQDLTSEEIKRLAPVEKRCRALCSLERKVARIEAEAHRPDAGETKPDVPGDRAKLRRWKDRELGLWPWVDPLFDHPAGRNADLMRRFQEALDLIHLRHRRGRNFLRRELAARDQRIADLENQSAYLVGENRQLRKQLAEYVAQGQR